MKIDTAADRPDIVAVSANVEAGQRIVVRDHKRAQNLFNRIRENIEVHELVEDLDAYMAREDLTLDALHLFDPAVSEELRDIYEMHRSCLVHGGLARRALPGTSPKSPVSQEGNERTEDETGYW